MSKALACTRSTSAHCYVAPFRRSRRHPAPFSANTEHRQISSRAQQQTQRASRREVAALLPATWLLCQQPASAEEQTTTTLAPPAAAPAATDSSTPSTSSAAPSSVLQSFVDNEYELQVPSNYTYIETPIVRVERGPQPERSPVLGRFEAPDGEPGTISILMRRANALKQTILQVNDISQLGNPIEVAQLILPRGSTLLATATAQVPVPAKQTPVGLVELPAQTYYRFEFTTPQGDHVAMSAAARRGSVYICGASMVADRWQQAGPVFGKVVKSFRIRTPAATIS